MPGTEPVQINDGGMNSSGGSVDFGSSGTGSGSGGLGGGTLSLNQRDGGNGAVTLEVDGNRVGVAAVEETNTLLVRASPSAWQSIREVVDKLDVMPMQVHIEAQIAEVSLTGDLSYVFFAKRYPHPGRNAEELAQQQAYLMGNCAVNYVAWMVASVAGVLLANMVPLSWGLGFAGILALLGVLCSLATSRLRVVSAGVAATAAVAAWALPLRLNILVAIASAVAICLLIEHTRGSEPGHAGH